MKKIAAVVAASVLAVTLVGCGSPLRDCDAKQGTNGIIIVPRPPVIIPRVNPVPAPRVNQAPRVNPAPVHPPVIPIVPYVGGTNHC